MKELSIEEKAKAYDEAIEKLRDFYRDYDTVSCLIDVKEELANLFPELKESEDEKIKKEIISFIQDDIDEINLKVSGDYDDRDEDDIAHQNWCKKAIAWLEKQGNSPIKWNKNTEGNKPHVNHTVLMKTIHGIAEGEWIGEGWLQYRWAGIVRDSDVLSWIEFSDLEKQGETVWSEETDDDAWMNDIISKLENNLQLNKAEIDWFKSLKQRIGGYYG